MSIENEDLPLDHPLLSVLRTQTDPSSFTVKIFSPKYTVKILRFRHTTESLTHILAFETYRGAYNNLYRQSTNNSSNDRDKREIKVINNYQLKEKMEKYV